MMNAIDVRPGRSTRPASTAGPRQLVTRGRARGTWRSRVPGANTLVRASFVVGGFASRVPVTALGPLGPLANVLMLAPALAVGVFGIDPR